MWKIQELMTLPLAPPLFLVAGCGCLEQTKDYCLFALDLGVGCTSKRLSLSQSKKTSAPMQGGLLVQIL